ncbi:MAG: MFS transporter, partial [Desulfatiglandaceae bacterium]
MSRRWAIFAITSLNFFLSQFYRASNAVIAPQLLQDLSLDTQGIGLISASFFYAFALTQIPLSILLDRIGPRRIMTALSLFGTLGAIIFSRADSFSIGILGRILLGMGMSCNLMGTLKLLTTWFEPFRFATLAGILFSIGTVGSMAATTPLVFLVQEIGWRQGFLLIAGINFLLIVVLFLTVRDKPATDPSKTASSNPPFGHPHPASDLRLLLKKRDYWVISIGTFVSYGVFASFQTLWAGPYLMEVIGLSAIGAGNLIFFMNVGTILGGPAWGALSDKLLKSPKEIIIAGLLSMFFIMLGLVMLSRGSALWVIVLLFFNFGLFRSSGPLMYAHIKELLPLEMAGTAMTGINFFTMIGSAVFLQGMGSFMQHFYPHASQGPEAFNAAFLLYAVCLAGTTLLYFLTK